MEIFKQINGYENYSIGNNGTVLNRTTGKIKSQRVDKDGYLTVSLWKNNKEQNCKVHRLVGEHFVDGYFDGAVINHKDEVRSNNYYENLEWVTIKENNNYNDKPLKCCKKINMYDTNGNFVRSFNSLKEIGEKFNRSIGNLSSHLKGRQKTYAGHIFKYA